MYNRNASRVNNQAKENTVLQVIGNDTLMSFLIQNLKQKNRDNIKTLLRNKQVYVNGRAVSQFDYNLDPGMQVSIKWDRLSKEQPQHGVHIVFEDEHLIVVDKQAGILSIATDKEKQGTAYSILSAHVKKRDPANRIFVVHRLDRDTSGLMMFAKSEEVQSLIQKAWQTNIDERTYIALVEGCVDEPEGTISSYLFESKAYIMHSSQDARKGDLAITHFKVIKRNKDFSLLEVNLETGKKNQIRVHMQDMGHSIVGDKKYSAETNPIGRMGLHASLLAFTHPVSKEKMRFESKVPVKFLRLF
jgi:23S rRNA pseudouridine1911/1915/1917 synthase